MVTFSPQFLDEIRARLSVSSVVGRRVKLIRRGHEYVGLSPFSNERTPSFTVNDDKGFYHCFSTNEHGDVFTFLMKTQNLTFPEAVERLAEEAGLEMPRQSAEEAREVERSTVLRSAVELGCQHFEQALSATEGRRAAAYLAERGLTAETIKRFRLGYAGTGLKAALTAKKIPEDVLIETRLISPGKDGRESFDFFRDRVMFPIFDLRGRPVAFGGRVMGEGEPKYLNSPDTPLFHKGQILYGLALARTAAAEKREIIVAEGYMDVIALAQAGFTHAVAPLGTALTEAQLELLWRLAPEPILCFDGDKAGQRAALRAAERALPLLRPGFSLRFALLPAGKDPDDICRRDGAEAMRHLLDAALPLSEVLWRQLLDTYPGDTPERRAALEKAAESRARQIADGTVQNQYVRMFKDRLFQHFRPAARTGQGPNRPTPGRFGRGGSSGGSSRGARFAPPPQSFTPPPRAQISGERTRERILLATFISHPGIFDHVEERLGTMTFSDGRLDSLRQIAVMHIAQNPELDFTVLRAHLASVGYADDVATLLHPEVYQHAAFAHPSAELAKATKGWDETFALCQRTSLEADLERAEQEYVANPTEATRVARDALLEQKFAFLAEDD